MRREPASIQALREVPLFATIPPAELRAVARAFTEHRVPAGTVLMHEGRPALEAGVIVSGTADVRRRTDTVARLGPGDVVGEVGVLDGGQRSADVVATSDLVVQVSAARDLVGLLAVAPTVTRSLVGILASRVRSGEVAWA